MHEWGTVALREGQRAAFDKLESLLAREQKLKPICLVGDFEVGKTTLARYWLSQHFEAPESRYRPLGRTLLDEMKKEGELDKLAANAGKARFVLQMAFTEAVERAFEGNEAVVLDGLDVLQPYRLPLPSFAQPYARSGKVALLCLAENEEHGFRFEFPPFECHRIEVAP